MSEKETEFFNDDDTNDDIEDFELRLVLLIENTSCDEHIVPEHGLSIYIEFNGQKGLYDTGQTTQILENAEEMFVDIDDLDWIALSHGHYDHTGGLKCILSKNPGNIPVFAGSGVFEPKFALRENNEYENIGLPYTREDISGLAASITEINEKTEIAPDVFLIGPAPLLETFEAPSQYMFTKDQSGNYINDLMPDERTLVIRTSQGIVIITGCAHRGSVNITKDAMRQFPDDEVLMVLGGFHLGKTNDSAVKERIGAFAELNIGGIGLCHCTGAKACRLFKDELGDRCFIAPAGSEIII